MTHLKQPPVPQVPSTPIKTRGLVGKFFRGRDHNAHQQISGMLGQIADFVPPHSYLVQPFNADRSAGRGQVLFPVEALEFACEFFDNFDELFSPSKVGKEAPTAAEVEKEASTPHSVPLPAKTALLETAEDPNVGASAEPETAPATTLVAPEAPKTEEPAQAPSTGGKQRICRLCGKPGHNVRTCTRAKEAATPAETSTAPTEVVPAPKPAPISAPEVEKQGKRWEEPQELATDDKSDGFPRDEDFEETAPQADIIAALDKLHPLIGTAGIVSVRTGPGTVIIEVNGDTSEVEALLTKTEEGFEVCGMPVEFLTFSMEKEEEEERAEEEAAKGHVDAHPF